MTGSILIGVLTFCLASTVHYFALTRLHGVITARLKPGYLAMLAGICGAGAAHLIEAMLYAFGFAVMDSTGLGGFKGGDRDGFMDIFYFSLVNYTSLGLGDIYPTGHSRFLAGLESLNGFLLISCSASLVFVLMHKKFSQANPR